VVLQNEMALMKLKFNTDAQLNDLKLQMQLQSNNNTHAREVDKLNYERNISLLQKDISQEKELAKLREEKAQAVTDGKLAVLQEKLNKPTVVAGQYPYPDWWNPLYPWDPLYNNYFPGNSVLLTRHYFRTLQGFLGGPHRLELRYRGSRDGFSATKFHSFCDQIGPTLVLIQSSGGWLFGGYTTASWDQSGSYKTGAGSFLFSLTNPSGLGAQVFHLKSAAHAICAHGSYGPIFGNGHDICILATSSSGSSNLGTAYNSNGQSTTFFAGASGFTVSEIEVFFVY